MNLNIFLILGLVFFISIITDAKAKDSKIKGHYEIIFKEKKPNKSFYLNLKTKSLWSCDIEPLIIILIDGASGAGLIVNMKSMKAWKLKKGWKAEHDDLTKSARKYLNQIKSFKDLINKDEEEIDFKKDRTKIEWYVKNILANIINPKIPNPDISMVINTGLQTLQSEDYAAVYLNQNGKGVEVSVSLTQIQILNRSLRPIFEEIDIDQKQLEKIDVDWEKVFGYNGSPIVANLILIEEIVGKLQKEFKDVHEGYVEDVSKSCSAIIKIREEAGSGSNESD